jgi:hypothetical protein
MGILDRTYEREEDLPEPPPLRKILALILAGSAIINLGMGIGGGEWTTCPYAILTMGAGILWIGTMTILLQTLTSISAGRYTILTGEPLDVALLRIAPSGKFWAIIKVFMLVVCYMWMGLPALTGTILAAAWLGRIPGPGDSGVVALFSIVCLYVAAVLLLVGRRISEIVGRILLISTIVQVIFFVMIGILFVPLSSWLTVFGGFFQFGFLPRGVDWTVISSLAGALGNASWTAFIFSLYYSDLGWGLGAKYGYIGGVIGGKPLRLLVKGFKPIVNEENKRRFKVWYKLLHLEIWPIFFIGSIVTAALVALPYVAFVEPKEAISGWGFAAVLARYLNKVIPYGWGLTLGLGALLLWDTFYSVLDMLCRTPTVLLWSAFPEIQKFCKNDTRRLYYAFLGFWVAIGTIILGLRVVTPVLAIILQGAFFGLLAILCMITLIATHFLLPAEYRSKWELTINVIALLFYGWLFVVFILGLFGIRM